MYQIYVGLPTRYLLVMSNCIVEAMFIVIRINIYLQLFVYILSQWKSYKYIAIAPTKQQLFVINSNSIPVTDHMVRCISITKNEKVEFNF